MGGCQAGWQVFIEAGYMYVSVGLFLSLSFCLSFSQSVRQSVSQSGSQSVSQSVSQSTAWESGVSVSEQLSSL